MTASTPKRVPAIKFNEPDVINTKYVTMIFVINVLKIAIGTNILCLIIIPIKYESGLSDDLFVFLATLRTNRYNKIIDRVKYNNKQIAPKTTDISPPILYAVPSIDRARITNMIFNINNNFI